MSDPRPSALSVARLRTMFADYNPRRIGEAELAKLRASLRTFGVVRPVVCNSRTERIVGGHQTVTAAELEGIADLPVIWVNLDEQGERQLNLALNKISGEWDDAKLREVLVGLQLEGADMALTGFSDDELGKLLEQATTPSSESDGDDEIPEPQGEPITQPGDVWELGPHRLICADAGDLDSIAQLMGAERAHLCFTSPPYGDQREYHGASGPWHEMMRNVFAALPMIGAGQVLVNLGLVHRDGEWIPYWEPWLETMRERGWRRFAWYVWDQGAGLPGSWMGRLAPCFEFIFHFNREARFPNKIIPCVTAGEPVGETLLRNRDGTHHARDGHADVVSDFRKPDAVLRIQRQVGSIGKGLDQPAVFPVGLPKFVIESYTAPGEIVFEPFCGSGSTIIAAQRTGRVCRAVELAPLYVDVAVERFRRAFPEQKIARLEA